MEVKEYVNNNFSSVEKTRFGKIGVLMGGPSAEREISFKSGKAVFDSLTNAGIECVCIDIKTDNPEENERIIQSQSIDCAFIALHGTFGEDGGIQKVLESIGIPYTGSDPQASSLAMDKAASHYLFESRGISVPKHIVISEDKRPGIKDIADKLKFPLVVKPSQQGSSVGLSISDDINSLEKALFTAFEFGKGVIIEEYLRGREFTVGILDNKALPVIEIITKNRIFDYEAKYTYGMTQYIVPAQLDNRLNNILQESAIMAHRVLGCCGCSRVDIILDLNDIPFVLEVNTIPGLTDISLLPKAAKAAGIDFTNLCLRLIELAYEKAQV